MNFHGGNVHKYKKKVIDFSSNINPLGIPPSYKKRLNDSIDEFTQYPDITYNKLRQSIASYIGCESIDAIVVGNGAVELIYKSINASQYKKIYSLSPTFSEYKRAALLSDKQFIEIPVFNKDFTRVSTDKLLNIVEPRSIVIICNPNNPTGTLIPQKQVINLAIKLKDKECILIIDEAFMEFTGNYPNESMVSQINNFDNLLIIKAATKFFGMPGIRLGYLISSNRKLLKKINESLQPWNVNTSAIIAGECIFNDEPYIEKTRKWLEKERPRLYKDLNKIDGLEVYPSATNYYLAYSKIYALDAWRIRDLLLEEDVLIRTPEGFNNLTSHYFRIAIKSEKDNTKLINALNKVFRN